MKQIIIEVDVVFHIVDIYVIIPIYIYIYQYMW